MLAKLLAACTHVTTAVSDIEQDICEIDKTWRAVSATAMCIGGCEMKINYELY